MMTHIPVMLDEVVSGLALRDGGVYVDGTFGGGGYSEAILNAAATQVWGIDRDPRAVTLGIELGRKYAGRFTILDGNFGDMAALLSETDVGPVHGVVLDLGVSSPQLDEAERGFSFRADGPLDMRMSRSGETAADVVNGLSESELADIIYQLGEERFARRVAREIVAVRNESPIETTLQLAEIARRVVRKSKDGIDPATRTFLALRIYVNDELGELDAGLRAAELLLAPGGRLAVVTFHSLEDRRVKRFLRSRSGASSAPSRHQPLSMEDRRQPSFKLLGRNGSAPSAQEIAANPRARSARLRVAERTTAPAWPADLAA